MYNGIFNKIFTSSLLVIEGDIFQQQIIATLIKLKATDLFIGFAQFHQRFSDQTFGKILAEQFKKQIIAVSHGDMIEQSPASRPFCVGV